MNIAAVMLFFLGLAALITDCDAMDLKEHLSDDFIKKINSVQDSWTAGRNFHVNTPVEYLMRLPGVIKDNSTKPPVHSHYKEDNENIPDFFDAREKWSMCESIKEIRDQGECSSGWALAAAETMTDRVCIHSGGNQNFHFSAYDILFCLDPISSMRVCIKSDTYLPWKSYLITGIVSGGNFNSTNKGCLPYPFQTCYHDEEPTDVHVQENLKEIVNCSDVIEPVTWCSTDLFFRTCHANYYKTYVEDRKFAKDIYIIGSDEDQIRKEVYMNGPVEASFVVYSDFLSYKSGVYKHTAGDELSYHAVKIIGWGVENNTKYWLVANSWSVYWGDKGFFKILRGENHCGIENEIVTGLPLLDDE